LPALDAGDLWRSEGLRALVAQEMMESGDWIVPHLYGEPHLTKPPVMYAAIALASWPQGHVTTWSARLPSALAALATTVLFFWYFRRQFGTRFGIVAALVLPTSFIWLDKAAAAEIDMLHVAWITAALLFFLRALESDEALPGQRSWPWWLAALLCVAGGLLTKWTAPLFFYATVIPLLAWRRRLGLLVRPAHLLAAGLAGGLCLGWASLAIERVGWTAFIGTVGREALARVVPSAYEGTYRWSEVPVHPLRVWGMALPLALFAVPALRPSFSRHWDERGRRLVQALYCWIGPNLLIWSLVAEHAPRHSFPLVPGVAGLAALVWIAWLDGRLGWPFPRVSPAAMFSALIVLWLAGQVIFVQVVLPRRNAERQPRARAARLAQLVPAGQPLYVFELRDQNEGIMFYYGRSLRRLHDPMTLAADGGTHYCLMPEPAFRLWPNALDVEVAARLPDELGGTLLLVCVTRKPEA
jgi:4-amino-4-deoxy-L-arabinose transferase-like glycosyltransferase